MEIPSSSVNIETENYVSVEHKFSNYEGKWKDGALDLTPTSIMTQTPLTPHTPMTPRSPNISPVMKRRNIAMLERTERKQNVPEWKGEKDQGGDCVDKRTWRISKNGFE